MSNNFPTVIILLFFYSLNIPLTIIFTAGFYIKNLQKWRESHPQEVKQANLKGAKTRLEKYGNEITKKANQATKKKVKCIETGKIYNSVKEAAQDVGGANGSHIGQVCNKKRKTAYGFHWEWTN